MSSAGPRTRSLVWRLSLPTVGLLTIMVVWVGAFMYEGTERTLYREAEEFLLIEIGEIASYLGKQEGIPAEITAHLVEEAELHGRTFPLELEVTSRDGIVGRTPGFPGTIVKEKEYFSTLGSKNEGHTSLVRSPAAKYRYLLAEVPAHLADGKEVTIRGTTYLKLVEKRLIRYFNRAVTCVVVTIFLGGILMYRLARRLVGPLDRVTETAGRIMRGDLSTRIEGPFAVAEYEQIRKALNDMLDHLERATERLSRFSADVAHELRTPITAMRLDLEVLLSRRERSAEELFTSLSSHLRSVQEMGRLVEDLLFLARVGAGRAERAKTTVALGDLASKVAENFLPVAQDKGIELATSIASSPSFSGDGRLLERALANLVDNALKFTPKEGRVEVAVEERDRTGILRVSDTGPGVPPADRERVFERFWRSENADGASQGAGLGLSIVRAIMELHGGQVQISSRPGAGSSFELRLPLSRNGPSMKKNSPTVH